MKVKELEEGCVIWYDETVLGIVGVTLPHSFDECECTPIQGNPFDFNLTQKTFTEEQKRFILYGTY